jgi:hypothetical protein
MALQEEGPPDVEASMRPLLQLPGVVGYMVINDSGIPVKWSSTGFAAELGPTESTIPPEITHHAALVSELVHKSQQTCHKLFASEVCLVVLHTPESTAVRTPSRRFSPRFSFAGPGVFGVALFPIEDIEK